MFRHWGKALYAASGGDIEPGEIDAPMQILKAYGVVI